jgi:hypothetical protein
MRTQALYGAKTMRKLVALLVLLSQTALLAQHTRQCFEILETDKAGRPTLVLDLTTGKVYEIKNGKIIEIKQSPKT